MESTPLTNWKAKLGAVFTAVVINKGFSKVVLELISFIVSNSQPQP
jgi:hypothetical protein